jgi:hypothetical protein
MTLNCVDSPTHGAHICFQTIVIYRCITNVYDEMFLYNTGRTNEACFTHEDVFKVQEVTSHAIRELVYHIHFSVSVWAGIVRNIIMNPYLLPDR